MRRSITLCSAGLAALLLALSGCDVLQPPADGGPPADLTGTWTTGPVEVPFDTTFALDGDPTYRAVEVEAVYTVETELRLTDTAGDVRAVVDDDHRATGEVRYVRHDGVAVRSPFTNDRLGGWSESVEAVYVPPTLTFTGGVPEYRRDFVGLALDFSDGSAAFARRLTLPVTLHRLEGRVVTLVRPAATRLRRTADG